MRLTNRVDRAGSRGGLQYTWRVTTAIRVFALALAAGIVFSDDRAGRPGPCWPPSRVIACAGAVLDWRRRAQPHVVDGGRRDAAGGTDARQCRRLRRPLRLPGRAACGRRRAPRLRDDDQRRVRRRPRRPGGGGPATGPTPVPSSSLPVRGSSAASARAAHQLAVALGRATRTPAGRRTRPPTS